jgi:hypothetical protein
VMMSAALIARVNDGLGGGIPYTYNILRI